MSIIIRLTCGLTSAPPHPAQLLFADTAFANQGYSPADASDPPIMA